MFWGLIMEPKRRYSQVVQHAFHISMAALDIYACDEQPTQVMLFYEDRNYLICTLGKNQTVQCTLDLNFKAGDKICFATNGSSNVHLTGYLHDEFDEDGEEEEEEDSEVEAEIGNKNKRKVEKNAKQPPTKKSRTEQLLDEAEEYDSADDTTFNLDEEDSDLEEEADDDSDVHEESEDEVDEDDDDVEDDSNDDDDGSSSLSDSDEEEVAPKVNGISSKKRDAQKKKGKQNEQQPQSTKGEKSPNKVETTPQLNNSLKGNKGAKAEKTPKGNKTPKKEENVAKTPNQQAKSPQQRRLEGDVMIQEMKVGDGPVVKPGKMVQVYYEGRLKQNNKIFDQNKQGAGFKFRLGKQEVIKGWDVGVNGMKIGGRRRIICPPAMAYGQKGSPPVIPPNSTLIFDVELKNIL